MTRHELFQFVDRQRLAVISSLSPSGAPQSALVGFAASTRLELIFDTLDSTRKYRNLRADPRASVVVGWDGEVTVQLDGEARLLAGAELRRCQEIYFAKWPDGPSRLSWPGIAYFAFVPHWARYSDFSVGSQTTAELDLRGPAPEEQP